MGEGDHFAASSLEFTPTWVVSAVCALIVGISLFAEHGLHQAGEYLKKNKQNHLYEALQKVKEELMLLGFISLLMTATQSWLIKICVPEDVVRHLLPCKLPVEHSTSHHRRLLSDVHENVYCSAENKVQLVSLEALHHLHIFIFVLAVVHVNFSVITVVFGGLKIRKWKKWEDAIEQEYLDSEREQKPKVTNVHEHDFIKSRFLGTEARWTILAKVQCFFKQFYGSVTKSDYAALRSGFIMTHCKGNPRFNFHKYIVRALEDDFKIVVGISWYLWLFVVLFLFLDLHGWHTYFWIASIPLIILFAVGTKLELIISNLARSIAKKHVAIEGDLVVKPDDSHFWFNRPHLILLLIHFILFQNAFEIAFFFWIWVQYGFDSCIMGEVRFIVPRLVIGVLIQLVASYSTLPLYVIVTHMGSNFKKAVFDEDVQVGLVGWAKKAKLNIAHKGVTTAGTKETSTKETSTTTGFAMAVMKPKEPKQSTAEEPQHPQPPESQLDGFIPVVPQRSRTRQ